MSVHSAMSISVSGLNAYATALEVVSDNIANTGTTGYKAETTSFADMVAGYYSTGTSATEREGSGASVIDVSKDFSSGSINTTGTWSDMALVGNGFFNVKDSSGATSYTRDGSFSMDSSGYLVNAEGYQVLGSDGNAIQVETDPSNPKYSNYYANSSGQIYGNPVDGGDAVAIGSPLRVTTFANPNGLVRSGQNMYTQGYDSGTAVNGTAGDGIRGTVSDYSLEGSNVDLASEMVKMISYQADYNANSKSITTANNMIETVLNLVQR